MRMIGKFARRIRAAAAVFTCVVAATAVGSSAHADEAAASQDSPEIRLSAATWKDVEKLVADHSGRIVVVDVWSTSCLPCMTEFPHLLTLQKTHGEKLVCVSFNVDYVGIKSKPAEYYRPRVETFLRKHNATVINLMCTMESDRLFADLELDSIPAVYVYGTDGKLKRRFDSSLLEDGEEEAFTYAADINPFVAELISRSR